MPTQNSGVDPSVDERILPKLKSLTEWEMPDEWKRMFANLVTECEAEHAAGRPNPDV